MFQYTYRCINIEPPKQKSKAMWAFAEYCIFVRSKRKKNENEKKKTKKVNRICWICICACVMVGNIPDFCVYNILFLIYV